MEKKQKQQQQLPSLSHAACTSIPLLLLMSLFGVWSGSPATPSPVEYCTTVMLSLANCLSFVEERSNSMRPEGSCYANLKEVVKAHMVCLCEGFKASSSLSLQLNMTRALSLPIACHLSTPTLSQCNNAAVTGISPAPPAYRFFANPPIRSPLAVSAGVVGTPAPSLATAEAAIIQIAHASLLASIAAMVALYY